MKEQASPVYEASRLSRPGPGVGISLLMESAAETQGSSVEVGEVVSVAVWRGRMSRFIWPGAMARSAETVEAARATARRAVLVCIFVVGNDEDVVSGGVQWSTMEEQRDGRG